WPAEHAAAWPRVPRALALIIGVEEIGPALVECAIAGRMVAQHEGLEKPARRDEVPCGGRGGRHRLDRRGGDGRELGEREAQAAHGRVSVAQGLRLLP